MAERYENEREAQLYPPDAEVGGEAEDGSDWGEPVTEGDVAAGDGWKPARAYDLRPGTKVRITWSDGRVSEGRVGRKFRGWDCRIDWPGGGIYRLYPGGPGVRENHDVARMEVQR